MNKLAKALHTVKVICNLSVHLSQQDDSLTPQQCIPQALAILGYPADIADPDGIVEQVNKQLSRKGF
jgi:hypothetical protein